MKLKNLQKLKKYRVADKKNSQLFSLRSTVDHQLIADRSVTTQKPTLHSNIVNKMDQIIKWIKLRSEFLPSVVTTFLELNSKYLSFGLAEILIFCFIRDYILFLINN